MKRTSSPSPACSTQRSTPFALTITRDARPRYRTISTSQGAWCTTFVLTEPSRSAAAPRSARASRRRSARRPSPRPPATRTSAGSPCPSTKSTAIPGVASMPRAAFSSAFARRLGTPPGRTGERRPAAGRAERGRPSPTLTTRRADAPIDDPRSARSTSARSACSDAVEPNHDPSPSSAPFSASRRHDRSASQPPSESARPSAGRVHRRKEQRHLAERETSGTIAAPVKGASGQPATSSGNRATARRSPPSTPRRQGSPRRRRSRGGRARRR